MVNTSATSSKPTPSSSLPSPFETIDAILAQYAKNLKPGETISIPLYKGPTSTTSVDPFLANRTKKRLNAEGGTSTSSAGNSKSGGGVLSDEVQEELKRYEASFPRMAKFIETVTKPNFTDGVLKNGRMYEEEIPKVKDDSDEEDGAQDGQNGNSRKKKRWKRNQIPKRHWVIQPNKEFIEKFQAKLLRKNNPERAAEMEEVLAKKLSSRYEGLPEANASQYVMFSALRGVRNGMNGNGGKDPLDDNKAYINIVPVHGYTSFTQPYKLRTLDMQDAEQAIENQRTNMTRYMMHTKKGGNLMTEPGVGEGIHKRSMAKARLFGKLAVSKDGGNDEDEQDDIMGDLAFRNRKGGGSSKARKELLATLGDADLAVDDDGILGGANDNEFGGKRRFGRFNNATAQNSMKNEGNDSRGVKRKHDDGGNKAASTSDGLAMQDDFYQRDVGAEYQDLDYDPNENQFDNDDVDIGAGDLEDFSGGFAVDNSSDSDDDSGSDGDEDDDALGASLLGGTGFATSKGMKAMLARAQGEPADSATPSATNSKDAASNSDSSPIGSDGSDDDTSKAAPSKKSVVKKKVDLKQEKLVDANGDRILSLEAVRREIWLHSGSIPPKKLATIFNCTKRNKDQFRRICRELCSLKDTPEGKMLELKQHYAKG